MGFGGFFGQGNNFGGFFSPGNNFGGFFGDGLGPANPFQGPNPYSGNQPSNDEVKVRDFRRLCSDGIQTLELGIIS
jgi:hypothetical protein